MDEYTPKMERANAMLYRNACSALAVLEMVRATQTIKEVKEVLRVALAEVREAYKEDRTISHEELQKYASIALKMAMKEGVAIETRQKGKVITFTSVVDEDIVGSTVLAVSYPDGGIDYYPTEITEEERKARVDAQVDQLIDRFVVK